MWKKLTSIKLISSLVVALAFYIFVFPPPISATISLSILNPQVTGDDEVTVQVDVSGLGASSCTEGKCYLQGMFTKSTDPASYFGYTQNNHGDWYKYSGSYTKEEIQMTFFSFVPTDGAWSGPLKIKNDSADPDYVGPGDYTLRVKRYTGGSGSEAGISNDLPVHLSFVLPTPEPTATSLPRSGQVTPKPTSTPTVAPIHTATSVPTATKTSLPSLSGQATPKSTSTPVRDLASVSEVAIEPSPSPEVLGTEVGSNKKFPFVPVILIIVGVLCLGGAVFRIIKNAKST